MTIPCFNCARLVNGHWMVKFPYKLVPAIEPHSSSWIPSASSTACDPLAALRRQTQGTHRVSEGSKRCSPLRRSNVHWGASWEGIKSPQSASYQIPTTERSYSRRVAAPNPQRHNLSVGSAPRQSLVFCTGTNCSDVDNACPCEGGDENKYRMAPPIASISTMKAATPPTNSP
jgi:hypothetical protein